MSRISKVILLTVVWASVSSCSKNGEANDLARAQQCLDQVPQTAPASAESCMTYVNPYDSQQAKILKCDILMTSGGLVENKVVQAYNALQDSSQTNKAASFMAALSLDVPNVDDGYATAVKADAFCQASGVPGLKYLSSIVVQGSAMAQMLHAPIPTDPAQLNSTINGLITQCGVASPPASCTTNLPVIGQSVVNLAGSYCATAAANADVCSQVNDAVNSAGGDTTKVGQALFCYLNHKTYDAASNACQ